METQTRQQEQTQYMEDKVGSESYANYAAYILGFQAKKPHKCNCGPTAPCKISGICTCLGKRLETLAEVKI